MTRAKVCGLTNEPDLRAAVDAGADAVGFIADVPVDTPREVSIEQAADLAAAAPPFVTTVLVTMPEAPERALELAERVNPDAVQLHGDLSVGDVERVAENTRAAVLKTVDAEDSEGARYDDAADALLVDSVDAEGAGGTGRTHDWDATREFADSVDSPVVLAGGLTPENVAEAVATVEPFAVDVASGVEKTGGEKDHDAVRRFVASATERREVEA
ncbi:N-(5'-phosphoribosyl)anthranilate isomerase [Halobacterium hubeiense]|uniref:N-(5'-phosphoribosyl)anthranilate isomerase n=1 Tax=Halobacterium hubeiense TaxID=1407499 RepID=A0A0U5H458_9EURY|nr:phosphoribosylanthranilate isomerase [Halobacterium hubeiense]CQH59423.1 N-(5'-phosphoribosyl)anthranilate isomerase [Halobacterium hubeiense]